MNMPDILYKGDNVVIQNNDIQFNKTRNMEDVAIII